MHVGEKDFRKKSRTQEAGFLTHGRDAYGFSFVFKHRHNHSLIITQAESNSEFHRQYIMKTKKGTISMAKRWMVEVSDVLKDHPLSIFVEMAIT
jgi:hypothetical protein